MHLHFFGTATLSFVDNIRVEAGDEFEIDLPALGAPLTQPAGHRARWTHARRHHARCEVNRMNMHDARSESWPPRARASLFGGLFRRRAKDERIVLGFTQIGAESEWRTANTESIKSAAATMNIDLRFADAQQKQENQIKAIRSFIAQKVDVIAFSPVVETGWDTVLREAKAANIPVILTDRSVTADPSLYAGFIGSDFVEEGRKAGRWVAERFKDATERRATSSSCRARSAPARPSIARRASRKSSPRIRASRSSARSPATSRAPRARKSWRHSSRPSRARSTCSTRTTTTWPSARSRPSRKRASSPGRDILIVSIDAVKGAFEAMIAGKLNVTIECNPLLGPQLMTSVAEVVAGRPIPKRIVVDEQVFPMETAKQHIQSRKY